MKGGEGLNRIDEALKSLLIIVVFTAAMQWIASGTRRTVQVQRPRPAGLTEIEQKIYQRFYEFGPNVASMALAISMAENDTRDCARDNAGLNRNGTVDYGLFQINSMHQRSFRQYDFRDCDDNIEVAYQLVKRNLARNLPPFDNWATYGNKAYLRHLPRFQNI